MSNNVTGSTLKFIDNQLSFKGLAPSSKVGLQT